MNVDDFERNICFECIRKNNCSWIIEFRKGRRLSFMGKELTTCPARKVGEALECKPDIKTGSVNQLSLF